MRKETEMQKLLSCLAPLSLVLMAGCAHNTAGLGEHTGTTNLPTGARLLGSHQDQCSGNVQLDSSSIAGGSLNANLFVQPGQNGTFQVENDNVKWACVQGNSPNVQTLNCPGGTKYVRVTRPAEGDNTLFECFG
ncbi:MAG TPA: hypothetical protein VFY39_08110 [Gammaproteobacteria bacterium]|nr:hypothetical protein [Gammaproteobacteria bacterium]